jgi:isoleucyl-tRNA synthetase
VACHATQHANIPVSPNVLEASAEVVHKIRIVLRFLLGAIHDLWPDSDQNTDKSLYFLDRYLLHLLFEFSENVRISYPSIAVLCILQGYRMVVQGVFQKHDLCAVNK